jgi:hypothetical protein
MCGVRERALGAFGPGADRSCLRQSSAPGRVGEGAVQRKGSISVKVPVVYSAGVFCGNVRTGEMRAAFGDYIFGVFVPKWSHKEAKIVRYNSFDGGVCGCSTDALQLRVTKVMMFIF